MIETINLLLVEDNPDDAAALFEMLSGLETAPNNGSACKFRIAHRTTIEEAERYLAGYPGVNLILLDLNLPDSRGLEGLGKLELWMNEIPVIILSGQDDTQEAVAAIRRGAQDFLLKGKTSGEMLLRSIRYSLERHKMVVMLRNLSIIDSTTGLYNRRGFFAFLESKLPLLRKERLDAVLFTVELASAGDPAGEITPRLLLSAAEALRSCARNQDMVARIAECEFALLYTAVKESDAALFRDRIGRAEREKGPFPGVSVVVRKVFVPFSVPVGGEELVARAAGSAQV